ncbi:reverse transcriptase domain-containing protein, partial [Tanacetum coccineum]
MEKDSSTQAKTNGPNDTLAEEESTGEQKASETKTPENLRIETDIWKMYTDGASNEHGSGAGLILIDLKGIEYSYALRLNFANSNNDAEYEVLLAGLRIATKIKVEKMHAFVDSRLVANQVEGLYEAKGLTKGVLIEELNERSVDMAEVNAIIEEATSTWIIPI